jgi:hypothetical protein
MRWNGSALDRVVAASEAMRRPSCVIQMMISASLSTSAMAQALGSPLVLPDSARCAVSALPASPLRLLAVPPKRLLLPCFPFELPVPLPGQLGMSKP